MIKPYPRSPTDPSFEPSKSMSSATIWNNVNRFFSVTPTMDVHKNHLAGAELPQSTIQLGTHYSIAINQKLRAKFRNGNVQLRLPQEFVETPDQPEVSPTIVFHRLLSAFVPCDERPYKPKHAQRAGNLHFSNFDPSQFPVNCAGTSAYSLVPFEQKLMIEVRSLDLVPDVSVPKLTDNEVMNDIVETNRELGDAITASNKLREAVRLELEAKEGKLIARAQIAKNWSVAAPRPEVSQKKDHKRPKMRDKLN
jgi:hypothetical protein